MNMSVAEAQCLSAPQYVFAAILMFGLAWLGDKYRIRGPLLLVNCAMGMIGLPLLVGRVAIDSTGLTSLGICYPAGSAILRYLLNVWQRTWRDPDLHGL